MDDVFNGVGIEITLEHEDDFLKVRETLTRIGIASRRDNKLYQSCHILHKKGRYAILHFKELFALDGRETNFSEDDVARRNTIANLLYEWNLVDLVDPVKSSKPEAPLSHIKILPFKEKENWELIAKYSIGNRRHEHKTDV